MNFKHKRGLAGARALRGLWCGLLVMGLTACQGLGGTGGDSPRNAGAAVTPDTAASGARPVVPGAGGASGPASMPVTPASVAPVPSRPAKLGLALGGGAARGFAHIGVIQVLEEAGIQPQLVAGTSAGSLVAAIYASGKSGAQMGAMALQMDEAVLTDWAFPGRGLLRGEALARFVREQTGSKTIEQMKLPLGIVATELKTGAPILFQRGDTGAAVRASSAVPAVFQPVKIGTKEYVDGGLVAPVPVRYAKQMGAEVVIGVDISAAPEGGATGDSISVLLQTFSIMGRSINQFELREADVVVRPALTGVSSADFSARKRAIQAGREAMLAALPELRRKLAAAMK